MPSPVERILVAVDFSQSSGDALRFARALADALGASVEALHVMESSAGMLRGGAGEPEASDRASVEEQLSQFVSSVVGPDVPRLTRRVVEGEVHERIVHVAQQEDFDLIVMGTNGRTGRPAVLVGSVAQSVVRLSPRPVLTVREGSAADR